MLIVGAVGRLIALVTVEMRMRTQATWDTSTNQNFVTFLCPTPPEL